MYLCIMKNRKRIFIVICLTIIYCFSTNILYSYKTLTGTEFAGSDTRHVQLIKAINIFEHALQARKVNMGAKLVPGNFIKIFSEHFFGLCKVKSIDLVKAASKYLNFSIYFFSSLKETDIIFPFHYFW